jgi:hypothetical protein
VIPTYLLTYLLTDLLTYLQTNCAQLHQQWDDTHLQREREKTLDKILTATTINQLAHKILILTSYVLPPPVYHLKFVAANFVTKIIH